MPGQPQHLIQRGNNRSVFFRAAADYRFFLEKLQLACVAHGRASVQLCVVKLLIIARHQRLAALFLFTRAGRFPAGRRLAGARTRG